MNLSPSSVLAHARSAEGRKQLRYAGVSIVFVPLGQILLPTAFRRDVQGIINAPVPFFWNVRKA